MYLGGIHPGIQAAHATAELFMKYQDKPHHLETIQGWAKDHKTMILLNGGDSIDLDVMELDKHLEQAYNLPYAHFVEPGLNNTVTSLAIIVPEHVYKLARYNFSDRSWEYRNGFHRLVKDVVLHRVSKAVFDELNVPISNMEFTVMKMIAGKKLI
jgi:hypothetical protein